MIDKVNVYERLISFGYPIEKETDSDGKVTYTVNPTDDLMLQFIIDKATMSVKGECNTDIIPEDLESKVIDQIIGEFLMSKKNLGQLVIDDIDFADAAKSIQEGDTNITLRDGSSPAEMLDVLLSFLLQPIDYSDYRRIRW